MTDARGHRSTSADEALARIQDGISRARERADRATAFRAGYESLGATDESRQDGVRVTLDASGLVTALSITDEGASRSGRQVAAAILRAHGDAVGRLRDEVERLTSDAFGATSQTTAAVLGELPGGDHDEQGDAPSPRSTW
ncbi:hypothetical protein ACOCJ4_02650 [Knoellia sp. CPCC 206435]|uniref:hypothetical protein n=1 Tax=Knoellia terrae TaxID=3404797 RepID=UPI003B43738F